MYSIRTEFEFEAAHKLKLTYDSPCQRLHGHSYKCAVTISNSTLDENGMIVDFKILKKIIKQKIEDRLDHQYLNDIFEVNATAEYMSRWIAQEIADGLAENNISAACTKVELNETTKNKAIWEEDL